MLATEEHQKSVIEEGSIAETSVRQDVLNNNAIITIFKFTMTNHAAQDFLSFFATKIRHAVLINPPNYTTNYLLVGTLSTGIHTTLLKTS